MVSRVSETNQPSRNPKNHHAGHDDLSDQLVLGFEVEKIIRQPQKKKKRRTTTDDDGDGGQWLAVSRCNILIQSV
jgi:hypothetical protein